MFAFFDTFFLAVTLLTTHVKLNALNDLLIEDGRKIYYVEMREQTPGFDYSKKCLYDTALFPYVKDWETVNPKTGHTYPPKPDEVIGYALIATKQKCPGKEVQPVFLTSEKPLYWLFGAKYVVREHARFDTDDYVQTKPEDRPKWLPQVLKTIESESEKDPAAKQLLVDMEAALTKAKEKVASEATQKTQEN